MSIVHGMERDRLVLSNKRQQAIITTLNEKGQAILTVKCFAIFSTVEFYKTEAKSYIFKLNLYSFPHSKL